MNRETLERVGVLIRGYWRIWGERTGKIHRALGQFVVLHSEGVRGGLLRQNVTERSLWLNIRELIWDAGYDNHDSCAWCCNIYFKLYYSKHSQLSEVPICQLRADLEDDEGSIPRIAAQMSIEEAAYL